MQSDGRVNVELLENYRFRVTFPDSEKTVLLMDEPQPLGSERGPNASKVLAAAIANCLSASLLFCLRRSRVEVRTLRAEAEPVIQRNEQGYWRVKKVNVKIGVELVNPGQEKVKRCLEIFENYCIVTGAVRNGIEVNVNVEQS